MTSSGTSDDQKREAAAALEELPDDQPEDIRAKELAFRRHEQTEEYRLKKQLADAWCAAFVIKKQFREPSREDSVSDITHGRLNKLADGRPLTTDLAAEVERLSDIIFQVIKGHSVCHSICVTITVAHDDGSLSATIFRCADLSLGASFLSPSKKSGPWFALKPDLFIHHKSNFG
jgi:hypothetical protein